MSFKNFKVTRKTNVKHFDKETGIFELINEKDIGLAGQEHAISFTIPTNETDPLTGQVHQVLQTGIVPKLTVLWQLHRCPAIKLEDPEDLVWLEFEKEEDSLIEEEPYTSLEHVIELADEGDAEARRIINNLTNYSDENLEEEEDDEDEPAELTM